MCKLVNIKDEPCDVYIGRGSMWGNPYKIGCDGNRTEVIEMYRHYFNEKIVHEEGFKEETQKLWGKKIGCHCTPKLCHGDIIVSYLHKINFRQNFLESS